MNQPNENVLSDQHLRLFGSIVQWVAQYEFAIQRAIAGVLRIDLSSTLLVMRDLDFSQKRVALLDLLSERNAPRDQWERVFAHLALPHLHVQLRDQIVHLTWTKTPEPHSIQPNWILRLPPGVEPAFRDPTADNISYTLDSLNEIATDLASGHERFVAYLVEAGLVAP